MCARAQHLRQRIEEPKLDLLSMEETKLLRVQQRAPELYHQIARVTAVRELCGGAGSAQENLKSVARRPVGLLDQKSAIVSQLDALESLCDALSTCSDARAAVRLKCTIMSRLSEAESALKDFLSACTKKDAALGKRSQSASSTEENARDALRDVAVGLVKQFELVHVRARGFAPAASLVANSAAAAATDTRAPSALLEALAAKDNLRTEALSGVHLQTLQRIEEETRTQDVLLGELDSGLQELQRQAESANEELGAQASVLAELDKKAARASDRVTAVAARAQEAVRAPAAGQNGGHWCAYCACTCLLCILALVALRMTNIL